MKLLTHDIGGPFYNTVKGMCRNTTAVLKNSSGEISDEIAVSRGVRQGDVLSPILFNIFINDITDLFKESDSKPPMLIDSEIGCLLYADDLVILSTTAEGLQRSFDKLHNYCQQWKVEVNRSKSKVLYVNKGGRTTSKAFTIGNEPLEVSKSYTYLGLEITNTGSFKLAQSTLYKKGMRALFKLKRMLNGGWVNQAYSRLSTTHGHITDCKLDSVVYAGVEC